MINNAKLDEIEGRKTDRFYRGVNMMGIPAARKVYEDQIVRELQIDEESPQIAVLKAQIRDQVLSDIENSAKKAAPVESVVASITKDLEEVKASEEFPSAKKKK